MLNLFDFFSGNRKSRKPGQQRKLSNTRLCPGCPANVQPTQLDLPKIKLPEARKNAPTASTDTKVVSVVNMSDYKKNHRPDNTLF